MCDEANNYSNIFCMVKIDCAGRDYRCVHYSRICLSLKFKDVELEKKTCADCDLEARKCGHCLFSASDLSTFLKGLHPELGC